MQEHNTEPGRTESFWSYHERTSKAKAAVAVLDDGAEASGAGGPASGGVRAAYLESSAQHSDNGPADDAVLLGEHTEVASCKCRSWFCPHCCLGMGLRLRARVVDVLETFTRCMMVTLTIDPSLFVGPEHAWAHVRAKRCIGNLVRYLDRRGYLHSGRYLAVVEWQQNGMPHWHLLLDASYIPIDALRKAWNTWIPEHVTAEQRQELTAGLGWVRYSKQRFHSRRHAAHYACAYLIKAPKHGYPQWVVDSPVRSVHRYSTSRNFWPKRPDALDDERPEAEEVRDSRPTLPAGVDQCPVCEARGVGYCDHCPRCGWCSNAEPPAPRTIGDNLQRCGKGSIILQVSTYLSRWTGEQYELKRYIATVDADLPQIAAAEGVELVEGKGRIVLARADARQVAARYGAVVQSAEILHDGA